MGKVVVRTWQSLSPDARARVSPALDEIFFTSSLTRSFQNDAARHAFRERWLGRYLDQDPQLAYLAFDTTGCDVNHADLDGRLVGYLVGAIDDPALSPRFADIGYFPLLAQHTASFPAHLHINIAEGERSSGIGSMLIARFADDVARLGARGFHIVTGASSRNVGFYRRNGLVEEHPFEWNGSALLLLGRRIEQGLLPDNTR